MQARPFHLVASALAAFASVFLLLRLFNVAAAQPLLQEQPASAVPWLDPLAVDLDAQDDLVDVIIYLRETAALDDLSNLSDRSARGREVVARLQAVASLSQPPVIAALQRQQRAGLVHRFRPFWIVNAIAATLSPDEIGTLAALPEVARIEPDRQHQAFTRPGTSGDLSQIVERATPAEGRPNSTPTWSIERIRAPHVWELLGIRGEGVTVAIVDTGVDWQHPALRENYRGGRGATAHHAGNWYHAASPTQTTPIDLHGHGTHVAGTAVGSGGIGVAPGAEWIAVAIADENGLIRDSDIHAAFEWLVAPNGRPDLAPDVVNNSWGTAGDYTAFLPDVRALEAAGIVAVFAAGNNGPFMGTINAPASYPGAISVAAEDRAGAVTWFSSRGPSPLTDEAQPLLAAPGAQILSAYPGRGYALSNGTSMAAPHVTGAIALMLSAEPRLSLIDLRQRLIAVGSHIHDPARGWGSLDTYRVVAPLAATGQFIGSLSGPAGPIASAIITVTTPLGAEARFTTDAEGKFIATMLPGVYSARAEAAGFEASALGDIDIQSGVVAIRNYTLRPRPTGMLSVRFADATTNQTLDGVLTISEQGRSVILMPALQPDGRYLYTLPAGEYRLQARTPGFRLGEATVTIAASDTRQLDLRLEPGPRLLVVDSGNWQYRSQVAYYDQALTDLGYWADHWSINNPYESLPSPERMLGYDAVVWTAPYDSPGQLSANSIITDFLGLGGRLLIAGQNVGSYDGAPGVQATWWTRHLEGRLLAETAPDRPLTGAKDTPFSGLTLTLNGEDSAQNQVAPDQVAPLAGSLTRPAILYPDGTAAALLAGRCEPFRLLYLGFGLEGVSGRPNRAALMAASLETLLTQERQEAVWQPAQLDQFALGGDHLIYTVTLRNLNRELTQTFHVDATGGAWPRAVLTPTLTLGPCERGDTILTVDVPTEEPPAQIDAITLIASAGASDQYIPAILTITHKTPGSVLLVDDDRFRNTEAAYRRALDAAGVAYDVWETGWPLDVRGSPRAAFLQAYDLVIWFTGYDWFQPISPGEDEALRAYLDGGGRLFLSSQDYLGHHGLAPLAREFFGLAAFQESITPTQVIGDEHLGLPTSLDGPIPLTYGLYQNFSDGLIPSPAGRPLFWHQRGSPAAVAAGGVGATGAHWRSVFWAFPFETLPVESQSAAFQSILFQLSEIGESRFDVVPRSGPASAPRVYSVIVMNDGDEARRVWITNTLPVDLSIAAAMDFSYDEPGRVLRWEGTLEPGQRQLLRYTAVVSRPTGGARIDNVVWLRSSPLMSTSGISPFDSRVFSQTATTWIGTPDLGPSHLEARSMLLHGVTPEGEPESIQVITYSLVMENEGMAPAAPMSATIGLPLSLDPLQNTLEATSGSLRLEDGRVFWRGVARPGQVITASLALTRTLTLDEPPVAAAYIDDRATRLLVRPLFYNPFPFQSYLPLASGWP